MSEFYRHTNSGIGYAYFYQRHSVQDQYEDIADLIGYTSLRVTLDVTGTYEWLEAYRSDPYNLPERNLCLAVFLQALDDWITGGSRIGQRHPKAKSEEEVLNKHDYKRREAERNRNRESARFWFEDRQSWDCYSFNFIATEVLGVKGLEAMRNIILKNPIQIRERFERIYSDVRKAPVQQPNKIPIRQATVPINLL